MSTGALIFNDNDQLLIVKLTILRDTKLDGKIKSLYIEKLREIRDNIFKINSLDDLDKYVN